MIYAVLLFIMEYSLREQPCTIDDISVFVDDVCNRYLKKSLSYEKSRELAEFIINIVLCDEGHAMYFDCFEFEKREYKKKNINVKINNKVINEIVNLSNYKEYGARKLDKIIKDKVDNYIIDEIIEGKVSINLQTLQEKVEI